VALTGRDKGGHRIEPEPKLELEMAPRGHKNGHYSKWAAALDSAQYPRGQKRDYTNQKIGLVPRLPGALFSNFCEIDILKFRKNLKKYKDVVNYIHYESVNFYYEIPCIATSAKKTKWTKVGTCTQI
jgi:hypothetical protein